MTPDEVRSVEDSGPVDDGDQAAAPVLQVLGDAGEGFCTDDGCFLPEPQQDEASPS